jgi:predicted regulator of Ras-like GTPase activity (Roadblock/LC7/MglB family)
MNIERIKKALPEVEHVVMFYNDGMVFQTTFDHQINIPKLGENLSSILAHARSMYGICNYESESYRKLVYETDDVSVIILKLGEDSNLALFFRQIIEEEGELPISSIKRYIEKIEELLDVDRLELLKQEMDHRVEHLDDLYLQAHFAQRRLKRQQVLQGSPKEKKEKKGAGIKSKREQIKKFEEKIEKLKEEIDEKMEDIARLEDKIETEEINDD